MVPLSNNDKSERSAKKPINLELLIFIVFNLLASFFAALLVSFPGFSATYSILVSSISSLLQPKEDNNRLPEKLKSLLNYINNYNIFRKPFFYITMSLLVTAFIVAHHFSLAPFRASSHGPDFLTYIIDNSGSMGLSGVPINGKYKVQHAINKIINDAKSMNKFGRLNLIEIGGESKAGECKIPLLTKDDITQEQLIVTLNTIKPNYSGATDITGAINEAVQKIEEQKLMLNKPTSSKQIIIITDLGHNCKTSTALNSIDAEISRTIAKGYVSTQYENVKSIDSKDYIKSLVVFALKSNGNKQTVATTDPMPFSQQAFANSQINGAIAANESSELDYLNEVKILRNQGIQVVELSAEDLAIQHELLVPNEIMQRLSSGISFPLYFWSTKYLFFLLSTVGFPYLHKWPMKSSPGGQREKKIGNNPAVMPHVRSPNQSPPKPDVQDLSSQDKRVRYVTEDTVLGKRLNTQQSKQQFKKSREIGEKSETNSAIKEDIKVLLEWVYDYNDSPYIQLHLFWKPDLGSSEWRLEFNDKDISPLSKSTATSGFSIQTICSNETGGVTCLYIEGRLTGIFLVVVESYYKTHKPFNAKSLALAKPRVDIVSKQHALNQKFEYSNEQDLDSWAVCRIVADKSGLGLVIEKVDRPISIADIIVSQQSSTSEQS